MEEKEKINLDEVHVFGCNRYVFVAHHERQKIAAWLAFGFCPLVSEARIIDDCLDEPEQKHQCRQHSDPVLAYSHHFGAYANTDRRNFLVIRKTVLVDAKVTFAIAALTGALPKESHAVRYLADLILLASRTRSEGLNFSSTGGAYYTIWLSYYCQHPDSIASFGAAVVGWHNICDGIGKVRSKNMGCIVKDAKTRLALAKETKGRVVDKNHLAIFVDQPDELIFDAWRTHKYGSPKGERASWSTPLVIVRKDEKMYFQLPNWRIAKIIFPVNGLITLAAKIENLIGKPKHVSVEYCKWKYCDDRHIPAILAAVKDMLDAS